MAGDGETEVQIGSIFLASIEANKILRQFQLDSEVNIVISDKLINVTELLEKNKQATIIEKVPDVS